MDEELKKEVWRVFTVASFLFITIFFILPYLVQVSTYFHEKGHQNVLTRYGIENSYQVDLIFVVTNFFNPRVGKLGVTRFNLDAYMKLDKHKKTEVNMGGIIS